MGSGELEIQMREILALAGLCGFRLIPKEGEPSSEPSSEPETESRQVRRRREREARKNPYRHAGISKRRGY